MADDLFVAREPLVFDFNGGQVVLGPHTIIRKGHPVMAGREDFFVPLTVHFEVEKPDPRAERPPQPEAANKGAFKTR